MWWEDNNFWAGNPSGTWYIAVELDRPWTANALPAMMLTIPPVFLEWFYQLPVWINVDELCKVQMHIHAI